MSRVRFDRQWTRESLSNEQLVDHLVAEEHVQQQPSEMVTCFGVAFDAHRRPPWQKIFRSRRCLRTEALDGFVGVDGLRRIDTEQSHRLVSIADSHLERVAVHHLAHDRGSGR